MNIPLPGRPGKGLEKLSTGSFIQYNLALYGSGGILMPRFNVGLCLLALAAVVLVGAQATQSFRPPTVAIVDIAEVFTLYDKTQDRQAQLETEKSSVLEKLKELEARHKEVNQELPQLEAGARKDELLLQKFRLEMEMKNLRDTQLERLRETHMRFLNEIRGEITGEIEDYSKAQDLDVVFERTVTADSGQPGMNWPIVHFVKPEYEITKEIADRLNQRYRRSR